MQVTCFGVDWSEIEKRPNAQAIVDEMICTDDIDFFAKDLPDEIWQNDSAIEYFEIATLLEEFSKVAPIASRSEIEKMSRLISEGNSWDELGLSPLTAGCYFLSLSPKSVENVYNAFSSIDLHELGVDCSRYGKLSSEEITEFLVQWKNAIAYFFRQGYGFIGHCG